MAKSKETDNAAVAKKPSKKGKKDKGSDKKKSIKGVVIYILISTLLIGGAMALLFFDVLGLRTNFFMPELGKISVFQKLIPDLLPYVETDPYLVLTADERVERIKELEQQIEEQASQIEILTTTIEENNTEIARLQVFEEQQISFKNDKDAFDTMIAQNDAEAYAQFYSQISPENAERLYVEAVGIIQDNTDINDYIEKFDNMKPSEAAAIFEEMVGADMNLVVRIMNNIDQEQCANILAKMKATTAASVAKQLAPDNF